MEQHTSARRAATAVFAVNGVLTASMGVLTASMAARTPSLQHDLHLSPAPAVIGWAADLIGLAWTLALLVPLLAFVALAAPMARSGGIQRAGAPELVAA